MELRLRDRPLPADTVVHVIYGGSGTEDYSLADPGAKHEVVFCHPGGLDCTVTDADAALAAVRRWCRGGRKRSAGAVL